MTRRIDRWLRTALFLSIPAGLFGLGCDDSDRIAGLDGAAQPAGGTACEGDERCSGGRSEGAAGASAAGAAGVSYAGRASSGGAAGELGGNAGASDGGAGGASDGAAGGASDGGEGGAAPASCAPLLRLSCDDGNDCTVDSCDVVAGCQHAARADDSTCSDHQVCTVQDHCSAGVCTGQAQPSSAAVLSELSSFGAYEEDVPRPATPQGLSAVLSDDTLVFAEPVISGIFLQLVRRQASGLVPLDRALSYAVLQPEGGGLFSASQGAYLVPLSSSRVALVCSHDDIEIYDVVGDKLVFKAYRSLVSDALAFRTVFGAAGHGDRLWLQATTTVAYDIATDGTISPLNSFTSLASASAIAVSDDNRTLFVGGQSGVFRVDVSDPQHPKQDPLATVKETTESRPYQLEEQGGYLIVQDEVLYNAPGDLRVVRESDLHEMARFPAEPQNPLGARFTTGAAFVEGGFILQRLSYDAPGRRMLSVELYALQGDSATLQDEWQYRNVATLSSGVGWQPLRPASASHVAVLGPTRRVVSARNGELSELNGERQGSFARVLGAASNEILAYSSESTHVLDVSNAATATVLAGGLLPPGVTSVLRVDSPTSPGAYPRLLNTGGDGLAGSLWSVDGTLTQFAYSPPSAPSAVGSFVIDRGIAETISRGLLYRLNVADDGAWLLDTFELPSPTREAARPKPIDSARLPAPLALKAASTLIAADSARNQLLVATPHATDAGFGIAWLARGPNGWQLAGTLQVTQDLSSGSLFVRGDHVFLVVPNVGRPPAQLLRIDRDGTNLTLGKSVTVDPVQSVLGIESERLYLAVSKTDPQTKVQQAVVQAFSLDTLQPVASYPLSQVPESMTALDGQLFFGARSALFRASPQCP